jgi:hypothetical protein
MPTPPFKTSGDLLHPGSAQNAMSACHRMYLLALVLLSISTDHANLLFVFNVVIELFAACGGGDASQRVIPM